MGRGDNLGNVAWWFGWILCIFVSIRLDPQLSPLSAQRAFPHPGDPYGQWIQDWITGPHYRLARVAARMLVVSPILVGIGYEFYRRRAGLERPGSPDRVAVGGDGVRGDNVPVALSRAPGRIAWIALGVTVVGVAVLDGWGGAERRTGALVIGLTFVVALNLAGWLGGRRDRAKPRDEPPRMGSGTEANP